MEDGDPFHTLLTRGAAKGAHFADAYRVVTWACGTDCLRGAVIDERTGRVQSIPALSYIGMSYQLRSRLLIVDSPEDIAKTYPEGHVDGYILQHGGLYFEMKDGDLLPINPRVS